MRYSRKKNKNKKHNQMYGSAKRLASTEHVSFTMKKKFTKGCHTLNPRSPILFSQQEAFSHKSFFFRGSSEPLKRPLSVV